MSDTDLLRKVSAKTGDETAEAPAPPQRAVPYAPVPMSWNISQGSGADGPVVIISIQTPEGDKVFFVTLDIGRQIGEALLQMSIVPDKPTQSEE